MTDELIIGLLTALHSDSTKEGGDTPAVRAALEPITELDLDGLMDIITDLALDVLSFMAHGGGMDIPTALRTRALAL